MKPVLFVTGHVPAYREGALAALHERETIEVALFGGRSLHGGPAGAGSGFPARTVRPRELYALAASGEYRAVVCPTGGRLAPAATWAGTRRAALPLVLWASLWAHPRSPAHALTYLPLRRLYRSADAVVTYGPHVSDYVRARGARNIHVAPQSVDNGFWRAGATGAAARLAGWPERARTRFLFAGRDAPEKGLGVLLEAWNRAGGHATGDVLLLAGLEGGEARTAGAAGMDGVHVLGVLAPEQLRAAYTDSDVLIVPSVPTATFREPWGLVVNEAMNCGTAVIASDAVGAAAGGLVRDGVDGVVVPQGDSGALTGAIETLSADRGTREKLAAAGRDAVLAYSHEAWAEGFSTALSTLGVARERW